MVLWGNLNSRQRKIITKSFEWFFFLITRRYLTGPLMDRETSNAKTWFFIFLHCSIPRYMYKPNTTDPEEIVSHLQDANISLADVTCDVVMIGKLQDTCASLQVKLIWFACYFCTSSACRTRTDGRTKASRLGCLPPYFSLRAFFSTFGFRSRTRPRRVG